MVPINENFDDYKDSIWKGYTFREFISIIAGVGSMAGITIILAFCAKWNLYLSMALGGIVAAVIIFSQFWKSKSGLGLKEYLDARKYEKATAVLRWKCTEYQEEKKLYQEVLELTDHKKKGKE